MDFKRKNVLVVILIGVSIFGFSAYRIGAGRFLDLIGSVNKPVLLLVIFFNTLNLVSATMSWRYLTPGDAGFYKLFRIFMIGTFVNNITPTLGTGGEPVKAVLLGKETGLSKSQCFAGVVSQRMLNMFPFITIGILGLALMLTMPQLKLGAWEIAALVFSMFLAVSLFVLVIYFYLRKDRLKAFVYGSIHFFTPVIKLFKKNFDNTRNVSLIEKSIDSFHSGLKEISSNKKCLKKALFLSFLAWGFDILAIYFVFVALGTTIHPGVLIITFTIAMISGWIPLFPGGLVVVDGTMILLYTYGGVAPELAVLATLLYRLASYWYNTIFGAFCVWREFRT